MVSSALISRLSGVPGANESENGTNIMNIDIIIIINLLNNNNNNTNLETNIFPVKWENTRDETWVCQSKMEKIRKKEGKDFVKNFHLSTDNNNYASLSLSLSVSRTLLVLSIYDSQDTLIHSLFIHSFIKKAALKLWSDNPIINSSK